MGMADEDRIHGRGLVVMHVEAGEVREDAERPELFLVSRRDPGLIEEPLLSGEVLPEVEEDAAAAVLQQELVSPDLADAPVEAQLRPVSSSSRAEAISCSM